MCCLAAPQVAIAVLAQVSSASACERNWSTFNFIHNKLRNRLSPERAHELVYVFTNLRLLKKICASNYEEEYHIWDSDDEEV